MHNSFETLQKKCQRYHRKQLSKKLLLPSVILAAVVAGGYFYLDSLGQQASVAVTPKTEVPTPTKQPIAVSKPKVVQKKEIPAVIVATKPTPQKVEQQPKVKPKDVPYNLHVDSSYIPKHKVTQTKERPKPKVVVKKERSQPKKQQVSHTPPPQVVTIKKEVTPAQNNLAMSTKKFHSTDEMIQRFDNEQKYDLALKISQEFYDQEQYLKASLWAKKANVLDHQADGAWIMYAKSEYARGHKKRAIEILRLYLANANSTEGDALLLNWTQGK